MAGGVRAGLIPAVGGLRSPGRAWAALAALLLLGALAGAAFGWHGEAGIPQALAWRRDAPGQLWRCWSAAFVHFDAPHLAANAAGALLLGVTGGLNGMPARAALAWVLAWPLTHALLWLAPPPLRSYAGLSGVLHAGTAVLAVFLVLGESGWRRAAGAALGAALLARLAQEQAWVAPLRWQAGWDFPVAVAAHASGALAGFAAATLLAALQVRSMKGLCATSHSTPSGSAK